MSNSPCCMLYVITTMNTVGSSCFFKRGSHLWHGSLPQFRLRGHQNPTLIFLTLNYSCPIPMACSLLLCAISLLFPFYIHLNAFVHKFIKHSLTITFNHLTHMCRHRSRHNFILSLGSSQHTKECNITICIVWLRK